MKRGDIAFLGVLAGTELFLSVQGVVLPRPVGVICVSESGRSTPHVSPNLNSFKGFYGGLYRGLP